MRQREEQLDAVEDAPADRPEDGLADEHRRPDDREEDREDDEHECRRTGRRDAADLAGDRRRFGLGEIDVGDDEGHRGIADRADLGAQTRRRLARLAGLARRRPGTGRWWRAGRRRGRRSGRRRCRVLGRVVQDRAPLMSLGARSAPMIPAHPARASYRERYIAGMTETSGPSATTAASRRRLLTAELLSIGSELTVGETRDTNAGELAGRLTAAGVRVGRITALPDDLAAVTDAFATGLSRADLVVSTGGLGPTPDDLTREAIAAACGETVAVDPDLEAWLRDLWRRREMAFPELNLKQAWRIPSSAAARQPERDGTGLVR